MHGTENVKLVWYLKTGAQRRSVIISVENNDSCAALTRVTLEKSSIASY